MKPEETKFEVAPYFDELQHRLEEDEPVAKVAFARHVHWGYWDDPQRATGSPEDYAEAADLLCRRITDAANIRDGLRVLDVGCGYGGTIASLNERFSDLELVGLNLDPRQLRRAEQTVQPMNGNSIRFVEGDACELPFEDDSFDVVLAVECIFHFESRLRFFEGVARVLRAGGRFALSDFVASEESLPQLRKWNPAEDESTRSTYGKVDLLCTLGDYKEMAVQSHLDVLSCENINENTLPTYAFLQEDLRNQPNRQSARVYSKATGRLEVACRMGTLEYHILSFARQNGQMARAV